MWSALPSTSPRGLGNENGASRHLGETRPIGFNRDNKVICGAWNLRLRKPTASWACASQRGFVARRLLTQNPVDLDAAGRIFGTAEARHLAPVFAIWDFKAAFPSLAHDWLRHVIEHMQLPAALQDFTGTL